MSNQVFELEKLIERLRKEYPDLKGRYRIRSLGIFGSYVHGEQHKRSDLDVLVEFYEPPGLIKYLELEYYLGDLLGIKVDLVMKDTLKPAIARRVLSEVVSV